MNNSEKRIPNFTPSEKECLFNIIAKYSHILEDKKTNRINIEEKNQTWKAIEEKFNAEAPILCYRKSEQLKRLYENRKKELRRKLAEHKKQVFLTGGGPPPDFKLDPIDDLLSQIVNEKSMKGIDVPFDSDSEPVLKKKKENDLVDHSSDIIEFEFIPNEVPSEDQYVDMLLEDNHINIKEKDQYKRCPPQYLRNPLTKELVLHPSTSKITPDTNEYEESKNNNSTPIAKKGKVLDSNRRRPQAGIRALTSSDVSEKYNILLDRRLVLIEKQIEHTAQLQQYSREEQKKKIEVLKLQEDILSLEKEEKRLKNELLQLEIAYKKSIFKTSF